MGVTIDGYRGAEEEAANTAQSFTNALPDFNTLVSSPTPGV